MAGYSSKNLIDKLGIRSEMRVIIMHAPAGYVEAMPELAERATVLTRLGRQARCDPIFC